MLPIYVINLPSHQKRLLTFKQNNKFLSNDINIFEAFNGYSLPRRQLVLENYITEKNYYDARALGIMKSHVELWKIAAQSQNGITIVEDDIIFHKDFITLQVALIEKNKSFDLIAWSYNLDWPIQLQIAKGLPTALITYDIEVGTNQGFIPTGQTGSYGEKINHEQYLNASLNPKLVKTRSFAGFSCYSLSPQGAKYLLDQLPIDNYDLPFINSFAKFDVLQSGIDMSATYFYPNMQAYICSPFLAFSPNERAETIS